jgi:hypothetical protein
MNVVALGFVFLTFGLAGQPTQAPPPPAAFTAGLRWEYQVLTKAQLLDLGNKELAAGLNRLGDDGWELAAAVDGTYIFKRLKIASLRAVEDVRNAVSLLESEAELLKERVAWAERMFRKGFLSKQQVEGEHIGLQRVEMALDRARRELRSFPGEAKKVDPKEPKPPN